MQDGREMELSGCLREVTMSRRHQDGRVIWSVGYMLLLATLAVPGQEKPVPDVRPKAESIFSTDLAEVGLAGTNAVQRVTVAPQTAIPEHTHTGRTSVLVVIQGSMTEVRGTEKNDYKAGDVIRVAEGVKHHVENHATVPLVFVEIN